MPPQIDPQFAVLRAGEGDIESLTDLAAESEREGFRFVRRLIDEYESGVNRFDRPGEALFLCRQGSAIVALGGLNCDPYSGQNDAGRVRRFYVAAGMRRRGVGSLLLQTIISEAKHRFTLLTLRTDTAAAASFYEAHGFTPTREFPDTTHVRRLQWA